MTTPKVDDTAETIVEFVYWPVILALAVGLAVGAALLYIFTEHVPQGERNDA